MSEHEVPVPTEDAGSVVRSVARHRGARALQLDDNIAEEVPVAFVYNDAPFAVMMATPADLEDFAQGFALSEGIVERIDDAQVISVEHLLEGVEVRVGIPADREQILQSRRRSMSGRSGCGVCGSELLEAALRSPAPVGEGIAVTTTALQRALRELRSQQPLNARTGATHAAGWALADGRIVLVREDVGRHNALDKLIGAMHRAGFDPQSGFLVVTSRASYEMAMKAASAGIAFMAAISAPTALALSLAQRTGLTLLGFARDDGQAVYTHPRRLIGQETCT
ncbi:formate dehydrogenase accessory sulfurtransferase FdhD [Pseudoxanthomonas sp.]|uniref:formate dehydrogenase accessory sulfurtransferase FdhD n=1 Tax=Pseudoxanthomonas sp. TaxID=1871049 RepID=UPI00261520FD|nr:formate dehydrogenase accessory sulfurtransferase FdhD [Pseudoxanthomonas sp.]WDS37168.1 MAG: formate dehydrogenase accessory sulfurtransferase FdhD [Pseudoxanthomonas sp.]